MHEAVVTGMGVVSSLGLGSASFARRMFAGESGLSDIRGLRVSPNFPVSMAGIIDGQDHPDGTALAAGMPQMTRAERYACAATEEALAGVQAGVPVDALVYASAEGVDFDMARQYARSETAHDFEWETTRSENCIESVRRVIETRTGASIPERRIVSMYNACVSSSQAIGLVCHRIRRGEWNRAVVGGVDARCNDATLMDFHLLNALSTDTGARASRPFTRSRSGFVFGEGAATLVLESRAAAEQRGATILGKVTGYAATMDAYRVTDGRPDALAATRAITDAIADAGRDPEEIDAVSAHGTSTPLNDRLETMAIKQALGQAAYRTPVTALKSQIGHTTVASMAIQAVATLLMLQHGRLAPTINYDDPDPECDLDYVPNTSRPARLRRMLSNSFGFGGQNSCLIFEKEMV